MNACDVAEGLLRFQAHRRRLRRRRIVCRVWSELSTRERNYWVRPYRSAYNETLEQVKNYDHDPR